MVFFCGFVVCLSGLFFVFERSDEFLLSVIAYNYSPFLYLFDPTDSSIFRGLILSKVFSVVVILRACCGSEICFSIVQAVMIDVVDEEIVGRADYFTVHHDRNILFAGSFGSAGIEGVLALDDTPFVLI